MSDLRRVLLWGVFTMSLVLLWDAWNRHNGQPTMFGAPRPAATASAPPAAGAASATGVPTASTAPAAGGAAAVPSAPGAAPAVAAAPASPPVQIQTDLIKATIDPAGATLTRLELRKYNERTEPVTPVLLFDQSATRTYLAQSGLVTAQAGTQLPTHLTPMRAVTSERELAPGKDALVVRFESDPVGGVVLAKTYTFHRDHYLVDVQHEVKNVGSAPIDPQLYMQLTRDGNPPIGHSSMYFTFTGPAVYTEGSKFHKIDFGDIAKGKAEHVKTADDGWVAMVQHYFVSAWIDNAKHAREFRTAKVSDNLYSVAMVEPIGSVAPGASVTRSTQLFAGPQEEYRLDKIAPGLELVKDYGWVTILAKPLFWLLSKIHGFLGNWGWSIVALVFLLKAAFYSLNASAYRSMGKMKAIGPKVQAMRERYKDEPQKMQAEMMRIYREEKVNPIGGCLPILIQMPFFIALYWVLLSSVEMRGAPWIGWIHDLADKDPYFILPILMTASSLLQVWLNPKPPDPVQAKMMWIMPLAFSVMFFIFPAGLVLYWLTNNILSIAQQWMINRQLGIKASD